MSRREYHGWGYVPGPIEVTRSFASGVAHDVRRAAKVGTVVGLAPLIGVGWLVGKALRPRRSAPQPPRPLRWAPGADQTTVFKIGFWIGSGLLPGALLVAVIVDLIP